MSRQMTTAARRESTGKEPFKHLALTTGCVACSDRMTASYNIEHVTENWTAVTCPKCKTSGYYEDRQDSTERIHRPD